MSKVKTRGSKQKATRLSSTWDSIVERENRNELSRERIVAAGIALADQDGLAAVSIRGIAAQLASSPMALYHYVPSKRDLLNLILDAVNGEFSWAADESTNWRSTLAHFAWESRRGLKRHPWASTLRASDLEYGPECIRTLELLLTNLSRFGLDMRMATRALGVLFVFVNGFVAVEITRLGAGPARSKQRPIHQPGFSRAVLATGKFPNVARFAEMGAELPDDDGFERALNWILDGIEADLATYSLKQAPKRRKSA